MTHTAKTIALTAVLFSALLTGHDRAQACYSPEFGALQEVAHFFDAEMWVQTDADDANGRVVEFAKFADHEGGASGLVKLEQSGRAVFYRVTFSRPEFMTYVIETVERDPVATKMHAARQAVSRVVNRLRLGAKPPRLGSL